MSEQSKPYYWHSVPDVILRDKRVSSSGVRLYLEISGLINNRGYCWASNEYIANLMGVTESTVSRLVTRLEALGYIKTKMVVNDDNTGSCRRIYAGIFPETAADDESEVGSTQKCTDPPEGSTQKCADRSTHFCVPNNKRNKQDNIPPKPPKRGAARSAKQKTELPDWEPERFEGFWRFYPRDYRGNKQKARRAWNKLRPDPETIKAIGMALKRAMRSERWREGVGVPNASTFLNPENGYWEPEDAHTPSGKAPETGGREVRSDLPLW